MSYSHQFSVTFFGGRPFSDIPILFHRQKFTRCSYSESFKALLQAVYDVEELTDAMTDADVIEHTIAASTRTRVKKKLVVCSTEGHAFVNISANSHFSRRTCD